MQRDAFFKAIGYEPHPKQRLYHQSPARFRVPCCGRRFGKSVMAGRDLEPKLFDRNKRFWCVGPTYDLGEKEFRVIWDDLIIARRLGLRKDIRKAYNKRSGEMYIEFPWQTRIEVRSAEYPEHLVGEALDGVIMSEAAKHKHETWERYIRPCLADHRGFADFPTTPEGFNWLYTLWKLGKDPGFAAYESWQFPSWDNPHVYPGGKDDTEILEIQRTTAPEWFAQEIGADFASFVGKIYPEFDESVHVKDFPFRPSWPNYMAIDFGYVNALAAVEFQVSPWDDIYVWREHYMSYKRLDEHIELWKSRQQPDGYHINMAFGDAADPEGALTISEKFAPCLAMPESKENWREGIDLVKTFLRLEQTGEADEFGTPEVAPKLFVARSCVNVIREFNSYRAPQTRGGTGNLNESGKRGGAQKQDDHAMDALRYGLMHIFKLGAVYHLEDVYRLQQTRHAKPELVTADSSAALSTSDGEGYFTMGINF